MKMYYTDLWELIFNVPGEFSFKEAVVWQAARAIREGNINIIYEAIETFNPDRPEDGVTEYSVEAVTQFVRKHNIETYIKNAIAEKQS